MSSNPVLVRVYARIRIRKSDVCIPRGDRFSDVCERRFTLRCLSQKTYMELAGNPPVDERICLAVLDYHAHVPLAGNRIECRCPASQVFVDVRGTIAGRPIHERITACPCGLDRRAQHDARAVLDLRAPEEDRSRPPSRRRLAGITARGTLGQLRATV